MSVKRRVVIHQPDFMPYMGFFHRLLDCDVFVLLDHVQLLKRGWHHRDKIKGPQGESWITVPIKNINRIQSIMDAEIEHSNDGMGRILRKIEDYYRKAPYFNDIYPSIEKIFRKNYKKLVHLNISLIDFFMSYFSVDIEMRLSSNLGITSEKSQLNIDIVKKVGGSSYLSGLGAIDYLDVSVFSMEGIQVVWQNFKEVRYPQLHGDFIPQLSCLDFAMNCGKELRSFYDGSAGDEILLRKEEAIY